ncbi:MAG: RNA polymerase sigma factor, partial [Thiobacillaceae bacterium]
MQDTEAIERLKRGDDAGLVTLVQRYQILAVRAAQLVTRERAMAEDVVQDAFVRLPKDIAGFDPSRPFAPWFLRTVVRDAVRAANKATHQEPLPGEDDAVAQAEILRLLGAQKGPDEHLQQEELRV